MIMRGRLFWKILILFWITFMVILEGVWVFFALYGSNRKPPDLRMAERIAGHQVNAASSVLRNGGVPALKGFVSTWPPKEQSLLTVSPAESTVAPAADGDGLPPLTATVQVPGGKQYRLAYDIEALRREFSPPGPLNIPLHLLVVGLLGGLAFSATLAWYLTKPIQRLRGGFGQLAQGNLGIRLQPQMGRRRDELADLALSFDAMATRLQQLITARESMLNMVSHELRSPLARLHLAVGLARQDPGRLDVTLERIELETRRLDEIVGEVLTLARVESGTPHMEDYLDLGSLAMAVAADAQFEAKPAGVEVEVDLKPDSSESWPTVKGNAQLLRRALENVVRNALQHSASGSRVNISVRPQWAEKQFIIKVRDQGPGMDPGDLGTLFEPFVRGRGRADGRGFGLGLNIAHKSVLAHGGTIRAINRPGGGLRVAITLPFGPLS